MARCSDWKTFLQKFWQVRTLCDCAPVTQENLKRPRTKSLPYPCWVDFPGKNLRPLQTLWSSWHSQRPVVISCLGGRGHQGIFFMLRCNFPYPRLCNIPIPHHHPQPSHWKLIASHSLLHTALAMTNLPSVPLKTMWSPKYSPPPGQAIYNDFFIKLIDIYSNISDE